jgi:hypothetical protein
MRPVLVTIAIVAVSFAIIAVAAGNAAASLAALTILVCAGMGTALYRRLAPSNFGRAGELRPSDQSRS